MPPNDSDKDATAYRNPITGKLYKDYDTAQAAILFTEDKIFEMWSLKMSDRDMFNPGIALKSLKFIFTKMSKVFRNLSDTMYDAINSAIDIVFATDKVDSTLTSQADINDLTQDLFDTFKKEYFNSDKVVPLPFPYDPSDETITVNERFSMTFQDDIERAIYKEEQRIDAIYDEVIRSLRSGEDLRDKDFPMPSHRGDITEEHSKMVITPNQQMPAPHDEQERRGVHSEFVAEQHSLPRQEHQPINAADDNSRRLDSVNPDHTKQQETQPLDWNASPANDASMWPSTAENTPAEEPIQIKALEPQADIPKLIQELPELRIPEPPAKITEKQLKRIREITSELKPQTAQTVKPVQEQKPKATPAPEPDLESDEDYQERVKRLKAANRAKALNTLGPNPQSPGPVRWLRNSPDPKKWA